MQRILLFFIFLHIAFLSSAQPLSRTIEEEADRRTQGFIRELNIQDALTIDTLYRMNLKYVRLKRNCQTREDHLHQFNQMIEELRGILTEEQFSIFMSKMLTPDCPRHDSLHSGRAVPLTPRMRGESPAPSLSQL